MNKLFIGGSRKVTYINKEVKVVIDKIMKDNCLILIGDANGVDKSIQTYLKNQEYNNIEVFCMENKCRNNIGSWIVRQISAARAKKDYIYYSTKDKKMAEEASAGLMVWDGKSFGTILNVYRLAKQRKKVDIYINPRKKLLVINNLDDFKGFMLTCTKELQDKIDDYNIECSRDVSKQRNLFEITL